MASDTADAETQSHHNCPTCGHAAQAGSVTTETSTTNATAAAAAARRLSLATRVCDQVAELSIALNGYLALEHFVTPLHEDENQASVAPPRIELTVLLRSLNAPVLQHMNALDLGATVLRAQLGEGGEAQAR